MAYSWKILYSINLLITAKLIFSDAEFVKIGDPCEPESSGCSSLGKIANCGSWGWYQLNCPITTECQTINQGSKLAATCLPRNDSQPSKIYSAIDKINNGDKGAEGSFSNLFSSEELDFGKQLLAKKGIQWSNEVNSDINSSKEYLVGNYGFQQFRNKFQPKIKPYDSKPQPTFDTRLAYIPSPTTTFSTLLKSSFSDQYRRKNLKAPKKSWSRPKRILPPKNLELFYRESSERSPSIQRPSRRFYKSFEDMPPEKLLNFKLKPTRSYPRTNGRRYMPNKSIKKSQNIVEKPKSLPYSSASEFYNKSNPVKQKTLFNKRGKNSGSNVLSNFDNLQYKPVSDSKNDVAKNKPMPYQKNNIDFSYNLQNDPNTEVIRNVGNHFYIRTVRRKPTRKPKSIDFSYDNSFSNYTFRRRPLDPILPELSFDQQQIGDSKPILTTSLFGVSERPKYFNFHKINPDPKFSLSSEDFGLKPKIPKPKQPISRPVEFSFSLDNEPFAQQIREPVTIKHLDRLEKLKRSSKIFSTATPSLLTLTYPRSSLQPSPLASELSKQYANYKRRLKSLPNTIPPIKINPNPAISKNFSKIISLKSSSLYVENFAANTSSNLHGTPSNPVYKSGKSVERISEDRAGETLPSHSRRNKLRHNLSDKNGNLPMFTLNKKPKIIPYSTKRKQKIKTAKTPDVLFFEDITPLTKFKSDNTAKKIERSQSLMINNYESKLNNMLDILKPKPGLIDSETGAKDSDQIKKHWFSTTISPRPSYVFSNYTPLVVQPIRGKLGYLQKLASSSRVGAHRVSNRTYYDTSRHKLSPYLFGKSLPFYSKRKRQRLKALNASKYKPYVPESYSIPRLSKKPSHPASRSIANLELPNTDQNTIDYGTPSHFLQLANRLRPTVKNEDDRRQQHVRSPNGTLVTVGEPLAHLRLAEDLINSGSPRYGYKRLRGSHWTSQRRLGTNSNQLQRLATYNQFKQALVDNGYPSPKMNHYRNAILKARYLGHIRTKREFAMFLAQVIHESQGLLTKEEIRCVQSGCPGEYMTDDDYPGQRYWGRGYLLMAWFYNYEAASYELFNDDRLARNASMVADKDELAWATALWYWKTYVHGQPGVTDGRFGSTTRAINGALECDGDYWRWAKQRFEIYRIVVQALELQEDPDESGCYDTSSIRYYFKRA